MNLHISEYTNSSRRWKLYEVCDFERKYDVFWSGIDKYIIQ